MLTSKFDLYKGEWLDRVFADRNKEYGAYELRREYDRTLAKAMGLTFMSIALLGSVGFLFSHSLTMAPPAAKPPVKVIEVKLHHHVDPPLPHIKNPKPPTPPAQVKVTVLTPLVVTPDPQVKTPAPDVTKIEGPIGPVAKVGPAGPPNLPIDPGPGDGSVKTPAANPDIVYPPVGLEFMPTPNGGGAGWSKFLSKNLRFPPQAQDAGVGGRVYMSFIIEKDGTLSNITVVRGAGYGMDEEATRVLKLAKPWKPGQQNGQPVRVKFVIPINFQITGDN